MFNDSLSVDRQDLGVYTTQVATIASVNLDNLTLIDEERNANLVAGLDLCHFRRTRRSIPLDTWLTLDDLQIDGVRQLDADDASLELLLHHYYHQELYLNPKG